MESNFWHERWQANEIGFHEGRVNDLLERHLPALGLSPGARIFLPLCGKTRDIPWLIAQGFKVVGVELSPIAVSQLFQEMSVTPKIAGQGALTSHEAQGVTIFAGDIFALEAATLGPVDAIYDRAALVALPPSMRDAYAAKLAEIAGGAARLLITFEYDQARMDGPPFSIQPGEVERLFAADYEIELLERREVEGGLKGVVAASEAALRLIPRQSRAAREPGSPA